MQNYITLNTVDIISYPCNDTFKKTWLRHNMDIVGTWCGGFPAQTASNADINFTLVVNLNKFLNKQSSDQ